tara:strand:+ start:190 stop:657 length:468 start_codon:yes stop_codon:yes gene_type:complete
MGLKKQLLTFTENLKLFYQLRLNIYILFSVIAFSLLFYFFAYESLSEFSGIILSITKTSPAADRMMFDYLDGLHLWIVACLLSFFFLIFFICVRYTVNLIKQIKIFQLHFQKLIQGQYNEKIEIKEEGPLSTLAKEVNDLTEKLEKNEQQIDKRY